MGQTTRWASALAVLVTGIAFMACEHDNRCELTATCPFPEDAGTKTPTTAPTEDDDSKPGGNVEPQGSASPGLQTDDVAGPESSESDTPEPPGLLVPLPPAMPTVPDAGLEHIVDGGGSPTDGNDAAIDGGMTIEGDGGNSAPLPEGSCTAPPADPTDGAYIACAPTPDGESCELVCDTHFVKDGDATCAQGEWSVQACSPLGSLSATVTNAVDGSALDDAQVYVQGLYDPETEDCAASDYCRTTDSAGQVTFDFFPAGDQQMVLAKDGFVQIAMPIDIQPGSSHTVRLDALPTGFLNGNIVVILGWPNQGDIDLLLDVPGDDGQCVYFAAKGLLDDRPHAQLDRDTKVNGEELMRIGLNGAGPGPFYNGTYGVFVATGHTDIRTLQGTAPSVRLIREAANGGAEVQVFELPADAVANAHAWHVFDLHGDGTVSVVGDTESLTDHADSAFTCVVTAYTTP